MAAGSPAGQRPAHDADHRRRRFVQTILRVGRVAVRVDAPAAVFEIHVEVFDLRGVFIVGDDLERFGFVRVFELGVEVLANGLKVIDNGLGFAAKCVKAASATEATSHNHENQRPRGFSHVSPNLAVSCLSDVTDWKSILQPSDGLKFVLHRLTDWKSVLRPRSCTSRPCARPSTVRRADPV